MRTFHYIFLTLLVAPAVITAFMPAVSPPPTTTTHKTVALYAERRDVLTSAVAFMGSAILLLNPEISNAKSSTFFYDDKIEEKPVEPSQMPTNGKLDLNSAYVNEYKFLPGMFPHAAGKIASHGPYTSVKDIYNIPGLTKNDIEVFKKYQGEFTVNPPGRQFYERINGRVST